MLTVDVGGNSLGRMTGPILRTGPIPISCGTSSSLWSEAMLNGLGAGAESVRPVEERTTARVMRVVVEERIVILNESRGHRDCKKMVYRLE